MYNKMEINLYINKKTALDCLSFNMNNLYYRYLKSEQNIYEHMLELFFSLYFFIRQLRIVHFLSYIMSIATKLVTL